MQQLDGKDFRGYDVIWGSPPCREFSAFANLARERIKRDQPGKWKTPPNIQSGLELVYCFLKFVYRAKPKFWIMENVPNLTKYTFLIPPKIHKTPIGKTMKRSFWGKFPAFLMPTDLNKKLIQKGYTKKLRSYERAKIPLACSLAFAKACNRELEK